MKTYPLKSVAKIEMWKLFKLWTWIFNSVNVKIKCRKLTYTPSENAYKEICVEILSEISALRRTYDVVCVHDTINGVRRGGSGGQEQQDCQG